MNRLMILCIIIFAAANTVAQTVPHKVPGQAIIRFTQKAYQELSYKSPGQPVVSTNKREINALFQRLGIRKMERLHPLEKHSHLGRTTGMNRSFVVYFRPQMNLEEAMSVLQKNPVIEDASANYLMVTEVIPNDPYYNNQWGLPKVSMPAAWDIEKGNSNIRIAILDVGFKLDHEDLSSKFSSTFRRDETDIDVQSYLNQGYTLIPGEDYETPDNDPTGKGTHGTHVAGIAAAATNNNIGVAGVGWNTIMAPIRCGFQIIHPIYGNIGLLEQDDWIRALDWVRNNQAARVVNMSFGRRYIYGPDPDELASINAALNSEIVLCASSGNRNESVAYPAAYSGVIAVGATNSSDQRASFSNYGQELSMVAPGVDIYSTYFDAAGNSTYRYNSGTSMASPHVAGAAALILSQTASLTPAEVKNILEEAADKVPGMGGQNFHVEYGYGRLNVYQSLLYEFQFVNHIEGTENYGYLVVDYDAMNPISSGTYLTLVPNTEHTVRTDELPFIINWTGTGNTEKHHHWYPVNFDFSLNHSFSAVPSTPKKQDAHFLTTKPATVETELLSGGAGGSIELRDPWYYYQGDAGVWHQSNQFKTYASPLIMENNDISDYGGVFLDQDYVDPNTPYYTVRVPQQQLIPFHGQDIIWYFKGWDGNPDSVAFQNPDQNSTAVVFKRSGATARAEYKGHLAANSDTATAYNNARHILQGPHHDDAWYMVYEDDSQIYFTSSGDDGQTWSKEIQISDDPTFYGYLHASPNLASYLTGGSEERPLLPMLGFTWDIPYPPAGRLLACRTYNSYTGTWGETGIFWLVYHEKLSPVIAAAN